MKAKRKIILILMTLAGGFLTTLAVGYYSLKEAYRIRTSANALPADVTFLNLPATATVIGFYRDGINYCAEFGVSEAEFRRLFPEFSLSEISEATVVGVRNFGDPQMLENVSHEKSITVTNGLHYRERWSNGGGYNIIYDRSQSRAYYSFAKR